MTDLEATPDESIGVVLDREIQRFLFDFLPTLFDGLSERLDIGFSGPEVLAISRYFQIVITLAALAYPERPFLLFGNPTYKRLRKLHALFMTWCRATNGSSNRRSRREQTRDRMQDEVVKLARRGVTSPLSQFTPANRKEIIAKTMQITERIRAMADIALPSVETFVDRTVKERTAITLTTGLAIVRSGLGYRTSNARADSVAENQSCESRSHLVILVHGIRTHAGWFDEVRAALSEHGFAVELTNYDYFDLIRFILPIQFLRNRAVHDVLVDIKTAVQKHKGKKVSLIAHSFGSYIVANILREHFDFEAHRVILCGSVVPARFPFEQLQGRFKPNVLNEVGARDVWPICAQNITWGFGATGSYGFRRPLVTDRWHDCSHSGLLNGETCRRLWVPFLVDGDVIESDFTPAYRQWYIRILSLLNIKYWIVVGLFLVVLWRMLAHV